MRSLLSLTTLALLRTVTSLDMVVTAPMTCTSTLPISMNFTSLNTNNIKILTFGKTFSVEGYFTYQKLSRSYLLDQDSTMKIDAKLSFGYNAFALVLEESTEVPLCWGSETGVNQTECPGDGVYPFTGEYSLVLPPNDFLGWAATGYSGKIVVSFTLYGEKAGECTMAVKTRRSGDYYEETRDVRNVRNLKLSGYETFLIVVAALGGAFLLAFLARAVSRCCNKPKGQPTEVVKEPLAVSPLSTKQPLITPIADGTEGEMA